MPWDKIVPILQTGLAGLAFLLAFLSYRIISAEQNKDKPRTQILESARNYFILCILLATVVGGFQVTKHLLSPIDNKLLSDCKDSFTLLRSREERAESSQDMRNAIILHLEKCGSIIDMIE